MLCCCGDTFYKGVIQMHNSIASMQCATEVGELYEQQILHKCSVHAAVTHVLSCVPIVIALCRLGAWFCSKLMQDCVLLNVIYSSCLGEDMVS